VDRDGLKGLKRKEGRGLGETGERGDGERGDGELKEGLKGMHLCALPLSMPLSYIM